MLSSPTTHVCMLVLYFYKHGARFYTDTQHQWHMIRSGQFTPAVLHRVEVRPLYIQSGSLWFVYGPDIVFLKASKTSNYTFEGKNYSMVELLHFMVTLKSQPVIRGHEYMLLHFMWS